MNRKLKKALQSAYTPPKSTTKESFLNSLDYPKSTRMDFFLCQFGYIRKRIWLCWIALISLVILGITFLSNATETFSLTFPLVSTVSSLLPFIMLLTITELARSMSSQMAELEMSCKYNLSAVVVARATILGATNLLAFILLLIPMSLNSDYSFLRLGMYMFVPYIITCVGCMGIISLLNNKDTLYYCGGVSGLICILNLITSTISDVSYSDRTLYLWVIALVISCISLVLIGIKFFKNTEDLTWNSL